MSIIDRLISNIAPHDCVGCGYEARLICVHCAANLEKIPERCYRCRNFSAGWQTCQSCSADSYLDAVHSATVYDGVAKELVWQLKFYGAQEAARLMATQMAQALPEGLTACLVPVPTATSRARRRGYDQAKLLARQLSRQTRLPYLDCLQRSGQTHQVGASSQQRRRQLIGAFHISTRHRGIVMQAPIILVDDVLTTGATLEAAAAALRRDEARTIAALVFAQPQLDGK